MKFLLVEDNLSISEGLIYSFKQNNYDLDVASNIKDAKNLLIKSKYDLIILDIMLPDGNGIDFYKEWKDKINTPVLFLTAVDNEIDVVECLSNGAEEYITKPFRVKELLIRIERIMNRYKDNNIIKVKNIQYDIDKMLVKKDDKEIVLTSLEIKILNLLFLSIGKTVTRNMILDKIWEWTGNDVDNHTITVYLKRIREKIGEDIIKTIKGIGYRIDKDE